MKLIFNIDRQHREVRYLDKYDANINDYYRLRNKTLQLKIEHQAKSKLTSLLII